MALSIQELKPILNTTRDEWMSKEMSICLIETEDIPIIKILSIFTHCISLVSFYFSKIYTKKERIIWKLLLLFHKNDPLPFIHKFMHFTECTSILIFEIPLLLQAYYVNGFYVAATLILINLTRSVNNHFCQNVRPKSDNSFAIYLTYQRFYQKQVFMVRFKTIIKK